MDKDIVRYTDIVATYATELGIKVLAAIAFWIIGRWLIRVSDRMVRRAMEAKNVDPTLTRYVASILSGVLTVVLIVAILGYFGVQTATFAALVAGVGIAIGAAWGGLLSNFAAGAFLMVLKPFKVGDDISAGGITGTVREIGLFATTIDTADNVMTMVGNAKIFGSNIQNFSANAFRRVDLKCQIAGEADHVAAMKLLRDKLQKIPNVLAEPRVEVDILDFGAAGPMLAVRPYCHNKHYWQVYFDGNRVMHEALAEAGFPAPIPAQLVISRAA